MEISDRILDTREQVSRLAETQNYKVKDVQACNEAIESIVKDYQKILSSLPEDEREGVERQYGRQVIDLRRFADWLPKMSGGGESIPLRIRAGAPLPGDQRRALRSGKQAPASAVP